MKSSIKDRVVKLCFPLTGDHLGREVVFARDAIKLAADERRDGYTAGRAEMREEAAQYHDKRGRLVARSSAHQEAWHKMAAKDIRALPDTAAPDQGDTR